MDERGVCGGGGDVCNKGDRKYHYLCLGQLSVNMGAQPADPWGTNMLLKGCQGHTHRGGGGNCTAGKGQNYLCTITLKSKWKYIFQLKSFNRYPIEQSEILYTINRMILHIAVYGMFNNYCILFFRWCKLSKSCGSTF